MSELAQVTADMPAIASRVSSPAMGDPDDATGQHIDRNFELFLDTGRTGTRRGQGSQRQQLKERASRHSAATWQVMSPTETIGNSLTGTVRSK